MRLSNNPLLLTALRKMLVRNYRRRTQKHISPLPSPPHADCSIFLRLAVKSKPAVAGFQSGSESGSISKRTNIHTTTNRIFPAECIQEESGQSIFSDLLRPYPGNQSLLVDSSAFGEVISLSVTNPRITGWPNAGILFSLALPGCTQQLRQFSTLNFG